MPKQNPFYAKVGRTPAGSFRITIRAKNPKDRAGSYRQLAVCVYKLAAEMEADGGAGRAVGGGAAGVRRADRRRAGG
jgi:hypothetical protein